MGWIILGILLYFLVLVAERTLVEVSPHEIEQLKTHPGAAAQKAVQLARDPRPPLGALLLVRVWLKILVVVFAGYTLLHQPFLRDLPVSARLGGAGSLPWNVLFFLSLGLSVAVFFRMVRWVAQGNWVRRKAAFLLQALSGFTAVWMVLFGFLIRKLRVAKPGTSETLEETQEGTSSFIASEERDLDLLKSIVKFNDVTVKQVMQPRSRVIALDFRTGFHELLQIVHDSGFSRMPVYDEDLDNVTGILYVKDLLEHLHQGPDYEWQGLIRTNVLLVPESKRISELLQEFKSNKMHMAIVVDEYGGSSGVVTMEDILEEVTGEIRDEFDEESEVPFRKIDEFTFLFEGQAQLNDVCRITGLDPDAFETVRGNADTLAGLVLELKGDIPKAGTELSWNKFVFTVTTADSRRIKQIRLSLPR